MQSDESMMVFFGLILGVVGGILFYKLLVVSFRVKRNEEREKNAYLKGVNYILNGDHNGAIEELTKAAQINSDNAETFFALGGLFRQKGEIDRAIRIHKGLLARVALGETLIKKAILELSKDYAKAGFWDRASDVLEEHLKKYPDDIKSLQKLKEIYESGENWEKAIAIQNKIDSIQKTDSKQIISHLYTKLGDKHFSEQNLASAKKYYKKALAYFPDAADAHLKLGDLFFQAEQISEAIEEWRMITKIYPEMSYTVYSRLEEAYYKIGAYSELEMLLRECVQSNPSDGYAKIALAKHLVKKGKTLDAIHELNDAISRDGKFIEARRELGYILLSEDMKDEVEKQYKELIDEVIASKRVFRCESCKHEISDMEWQCPSCLQWDTIKPVFVHS